MNAPPTRTERTYVTNNTTYESYDNGPKLNNYTGPVPCDYASVDEMTASAAHSVFSSQMMSTLSRQDPSVFYGQEKTEFSGRDMATFAVQEKVTFSGQHRTSTDRKFLFCVILGVVIVILFLASLACASIALWMSSKPRPDVAELQTVKGSTMVGLEESNPAASCSVVLFLNPFLPSDYYWIRTSSGSAVRVYCHMTGSCGGLTGGWRRIANLDFFNQSIPCPSGLKERGDSGIRTCGIAAIIPTCASLMLPSDGIFYNHVCGMVSAYQFGLPDAFGNFGRGTDLTIDSNYVDGVSLTYGSRPRKHIWTFAAALNDVPSVPVSSCQCMAPNSGSIPPAPSFVGLDYFCATGSHLVDQYTRFYGTDPLWDGFGCAVNSTCCTFNNPPWFYKQLLSPTTADIEMRVCRDEPRDFEDIALSQLEIYVHY